MNVVASDVYVAHLSQDAKTGTDKLSYVHVHRHISVQIHSKIDCGRTAKC